MTTAVYRAEKTILKNKLAAEMLVSTKKVALAMQNRGSLQSRLDTDPVERRGEFRKHRLHAPMFRAELGRGVVV